MGGADAEIRTPDWFENVYTIVREIPAGSVATYGQIADSVVGLRITARQVGTALRYAPAHVPWHRVVGAGGRLPIAKRSEELKLLQRQLLMVEGVRFLVKEANRIDMASAQYLPADHCGTEAQEK